MNTNMLTYLAGKLEEDYQRTKEDLAMGSAKDHGEYKYHCGIVRGILLAKNHIMELADKLDDDGD